MSNEKNSTAVVDAVSGVIGSLVAMITFYPLDVIKTNVQVSLSPSSSIQKQKHNNENEYSNTPTSFEKKKLLKYILKNFQGMNYKVINTIISNFIFFWVFSWLQHKHKQRQYLLRNNNDKEYHLSVMTRLGLSSLAAMLNSLITLPLDVLSTRRQIDRINSSNDHDVYATMNDKNDDNFRDDINNLLKNTDNVQQYKSKENVNDKFYCSEEKKDDISQRRHQQMRVQAHKIEQTTDFNNLPLQNNILLPSIIPQPIHSNKSLTTTKFQTFLALWSGIGPSLVLCSNPAIHYTFYDVMKLYLQKKKNRTTLSMNEAFCIGFIAKLLATIVTYPLIRVKVILMAGSGNNNSALDNNEEKEQYSSSTNSNHNITATNKIVQSLPFLRILQSIYKQEGIFNGLYKGCTLQIIHATLKSAIVMMMKEHVTCKVRSILVGNDYKK